MGGVAVLDAGCGLNVQLRAAGLLLGLLPWPVMAVAGAVLQWAAAGG